MKNWMAMLVAMLVALALVACGGPADVQTDPTEGAVEAPAVVEEEAAEETEEAVEATEEEGVEGATAVETNDADAETEEDAE